MDGLFITIEGPNDTGRTNTLNKLLPLLKEIVKTEIIQTREPGGILIAKEIRAVILGPKDDRTDERTEALLYAAARRQHLAEKVSLALAKGKSFYAIGLSTVLLLIEVQVNTPALPGLLG